MNVNHQEITIGSELIPFVLFTAFVGVLLALDLFVFHRKAHVIRVREALLWTGFWISLALLFNVGIYFWKGRESALSFLAGYLLEESLSVDNLFVFLLILTYFRVPTQYQHRVLFWGIIGAIVMRMAFILAGITLIQKLHWVIYVFGALLIVTAVRMAFQGDKEEHPEKNFVLRYLLRHLPVTKTFEKDRFFVRQNGRRMATPMLVVLIAIETSDLLFAIDSVPAVIAITFDPFIVYSSNIFAILGLRSIFFALAGVLRLFHYLHYGLSVILAFIGVKLILSSFIEIPIPLTLGVIVAVLALSILFSILIAKKKHPEGVSPEKEIVESVDKV